MSEYNICGVLVMTSPSMGEVVEQALNEIEGVEVHARENDGKLVVTVEGPLGRACANTIADFSMQLLPLRQQPVSPCRESSRLWPHQIVISAGIKPPADSVEPDVQYWSGPVTVVWWPPRVTRMHR